MKNYLLAPFLFLGVISVILFTLLLQKQWQINSVCKTIALTIPQEDIDFEQCEDAYEQYVNVGVK